ncbi:acetate--CoA ligase family protein [Streptomyces sp. NPDC008092]|uniref:acetate--CoA ligase family protein n=1 Tax=Streptomyces sp. NPDC008092 TaxID=3364808 RepID=UPI0036E3ECB9
MAEPMTRATLDALFQPRSVALIGASSSPGKIGYRIVDNLIDNGYAGQVYPVNRRGGEVRGLPVYPDVASLPGPADVAYVLVPADAAVEAVRELAKAGTKVAIVSAAGFGETGTETGRARESALTQVAAETGMRIVGPNCNGIYSAAHDVSIGFNTAHGIRHERGGVTVLSHSGALFSTVMLLAREQGMGLSSFVSVGNECDLNMLDYLEYFAEDEATTCLALVIDSIHDGERFARAVAGAKARGKSVLALKLGTSEVGASAAVAHSSRMAGSAVAYAAFLAHHGVGTVDTIEQLVAAAVLAEGKPRLPAKPRIGVTTMSGGAGTMVADAASRRAIELPPLSPDTHRKVDERAPGGHIENPVDHGTLQGLLGVGATLRLVAADTGIDVVLHYYHPMITDDQRAGFAGKLVESKRVSDKPHLLLAPGGISPAERALYAASGIPVLRDTEVCMAAIAAVGRAAEAAPSPTAGPSSTAVLDGVAVGPLDDITSTRLLVRAGVPMAHIAVSTTPDETVSAAVDIGWPVVIKGIVPGVAHKSDLDLVVVGIDGEDAVRREAGRLFDLGASVVSVQPLVKGDIEALVGVVTEPGLGRFVVFGLGGVHAEAIADLAMVPAGADAGEILAALARTKLGAVLRSPRWRAKQTFEAFADVVGRLAAFALGAGPSLEAVDINPMLIRGAEIVGVDALVVVRPADPPLASK